MSDTTKTMDADLQNLVIKANAMPYPMMDRRIKELARLAQDARDANAELVKACKLINYATTGLAKTKPIDPVGAVLWEQLTNACNAARAALSKAQVPHD